MNTKLTAVVSMYDAVNYATSDTVTLGVVTLSTDKKIPKPKSGG